MKDENKWIRKMNLAMKTLIDVCKENEVWAGCQYCPFDDYCTALIEVGYRSPDEWKIVGDINENDN